MNKFERNLGIFFVAGIIAITLFSIGLGIVDFFKGDPRMLGGFGPRWASFSESDEW